MEMQRSLMEMQRSLMEISTCKCRRCVRHVREAERWAEEKAVRWILSRSCTVPPSLIPMDR